jgi:putative transposase
MLPGIPVHVVQRGNNRQQCFLGDDDRRFYLLHLARLLREERCALHAYCVMTNHIHLLLTAESAEGCGRLMQRIGQLYAQYFNRKYERSGTLWEGRFHSSLVQTETYVLTCYRYIESNPVRAGLVVRPADYDWSSFRANAEGEDDPLVTPHEEFAKLGADAAERRDAYRALVNEALPKDALERVRGASSGNFPLGDPAFANEVGRMLGRRAQRGVPGRPKKAESGNQSELLASTENVVCP